MTDTRISTTPGALLRELARRGMTQQELATATGLSLRVIVKVNQGGTVRDQTLALIGQELDRRPVLQAVDDLLGRREQAS